MAPAEHSARLIGGIGAYSGERWIAGCARCRAHLLAACARAGFTPDIAFETDDYIAVQALVAAGLGVSLLSGLALRAGQDPRVTTRVLPDDSRRVYVAFYGTSPPPAPVRAISALRAVVHNGRRAGQPSPALGAGGV